MANSQFPEGLVLGGNLYCQKVLPRDACITDAMRTQHRYREKYTQKYGTATATERQVIHSVRGSTGTIVNFRAGCVVANVGAATITVNLLKNSSTILTSVITLDNSVAAFVIVAAASFTSAALALNDVLEISVTATAGGGTLGQGLFVELELYEDA